jgi:hypothetical protein
MVAEGEKRGAEWENLLFDYPNLKRCNHKLFNISPFFRSFHNAAVVFFLK